MTVADTDRPLLPRLLPSDPAGSATLTPHHR